MAFENGSGIALAEFLPVINSCNFFINFKNENETCKINVLENKVCVKFESVGYNNYFLLPKGICLKPSFLSGLQSKNNWISFRAQLEEKTRIVNSVYCDILKDLSNLSLYGSNINDVPKLLLANGDSITIQCKLCNFDISNSFVLNKVSQMPSLDWDHSSEEWFCHAHDCQLQPLKKISLIPKEAECFFDELSFYYNLKWFSDSFSKCTFNDDHIYCSKCKTNIGEIKGNVAKLWVTTINCVSKNNVIYSKTESEALVLLFENLDKDSLGVNSRLVLQSETKPKRFLFFITMDTNLTLMVSKNSNLFSNKKVLNLTGNSDDIYSPPLKQMKHDDLFALYNELHKLETIKVLFKVKYGEDEESGSWSDDVNVHILPCGDRFFEAIYDILVKSNQCLPDNLKCINNLSVGYIIK